VGAPTANITSISAQQHPRSTRRAGRRPGAPGGLASSWNGDTYDPLRGPSKGRGTLDTHGARPYLWGLVRRHPVSPEACGPRRCA
jgi:hypothetical protein